MKSPSESPMKGVASEALRMAQKPERLDPLSPIQRSERMSRIKGKDKGNFGVESSVGPDLWKRLQEHAESIRQTNMRVEDFLCRYLVVDDIWIPLGEALLIAKFMPLWNRLIDGFGNHDPGAGRYNGLRPRWDVLHPGRAWADKCRARPETAEQIEREVTNYLAAAPRPDAHILNPDKDT